MGVGVPIQSNLYEFGDKWDGHRTESERERGNIYYRYSFKSPFSCIFCLISCYTLPDISETRTLALTCSIEITLVSIVDIRLIYTFMSQTNLVRSEMN